MNYSLKLWLWIYGAIALLQLAMGASSAMSLLINLFLLIPIEATLVWAIVRGVQKLMAGKNREG
jgi:hypothetical protein